MLELFNEISQPDSAKARRFVTEHHLDDRVRFRNIFYPEVRADFDARGGKQLPALWDGRELIQGVDAVLARLATLAKS